MQVNVIDRSIGNQVNITETFPGGNITTIGQINSNGQFSLTVTTRSNDGEELRESVTGMVREDGSQYNVYRNTISHQLPYATRMSNSSEHYEQDRYGNQQYQGINGYATMQFTQPKKSHDNSNNNNWGMKSIELKW